MIDINKRRNAARQSQSIGKTYGIQSRRLIWMSLPSIYCLIKLQSINHTSMMREFSSNYQIICYTVKHTYGINLQYTAEKLIKDKTTHRQKHQQENTAMGGTDD